MIMVLLLQGHCSSLPQSTTTFSDTQFLGTSYYRNVSELMPQSEHVLNLETIRQMKAELLRCAAAFCWVCAPPKHSCWITLYWTVKSDFTKSELGWLWVQNVYHWLQRCPHWYSFALNSSTSCC